MANRISRWQKRLEETKAARRLDGFVQQTDGLENRLRGTLFRFRLPIFLVCVTALAFWGRTSFWPFVSADYSECLHVWMDEIRAAKGFHSLNLQIGNYTAPYHYLMAAMSYIPGLTNLLAIKITSTVADFCMAAAAAFVCWQLCREKWKAALCYAVVLCLPTVFLNSAAWGQCDAMYTTFLLLFCAFFLGGKKGLATLMYGIALSIKLQAIFLLPVLLIFWLCGRLRIRHLLAGALGYFLMFLPAIIAGGSFAPLWRAYAMQTKVLNLASNIYTGVSLLTGFSADELDMVSGALMPLFVVVLGAIALYCWQNRRAFGRGTEFTLMALMVVLVPFLLPAMRDRYYFSAEIFTAIYAFHNPRRLHLPLLMQLGSLPSYMYYLTGIENPFGRWLVLIIAIVPVTLFWDLHKQLSCNSPARKREKEPATH